MQLYAGHVLKEPEQLTIRRVDGTKLDEHTIELKEQAAIGTCSHTTK